MRVEKGFIERILTCVKVTRGFVAGVVDLGA